MVYRIQRTGEKAADERWGGAARRLLLVAGVLLLAAVALAACGSSGTSDTSSGETPAASPAASAATASLTEEERAWLDDKGTLKVGAFDDYPPFGFVDDSGEAVGIAADYWRLLGERLGVGIEFSPVQFADQLDGLKAGIYDSLQGIFPLESRKEWFAFGPPYLDIPTRMFTTAAEAAAVTSLDSLNGLKVAVVEGDSGQQIADDAGLQTLVVPGYADAVKAVADGSAGAAILDELVGVYYVNQFGYADDVGPAGPAVDEGQMTLPVQKDDTILLGILEKAQQSISGQELDDIVSNWLEAE